MMTSPPIPPIVLAAAYAQALPAMALIPRRNRSRAVALVALSFLLNFAGDLFGHYVGRQTGNSIWVSYLTEWLTGPIVLLATAEWQITYLERLMVRISAGLFVVIYGLITLAFEDLAILSRYSSPFLSVVMLGAATWTLLRRALQDTEHPILQADWFYVLFGVALVAGTSAVSGPIGAVLTAEHRYDLMARVWEFRAVFIFAGILIVTLGTLLPPPREPAS